MKTLAIFGDSFSSDWSKQYSEYGWVNMLEKNYIVKNFSQPGVSEFKIFKQLDNNYSVDYDLNIICHTSPYRIPIDEHPKYSKNSFHSNCDLIYNDIKSSNNDLLKIATKFFENFYNLEYAEFVHNLIIEKILNTYKNALHITFFKNENQKIISLHNYYEKYKGLTNHLNNQGNVLVHNNILKLLNK